MTVKIAKRENDIKIIFSVISLVLMVVPLLKGTAEYYRTLFIFLINRVIDLFFQTEYDEPGFFSIWEFINQWAGAIICALSFCLMVPDFLSFFNTKVKTVVNILLFLTAVSFVTKDFVHMAIRSFKTRIFHRIIENDIKQMKGENK